MEMYPSCKSEYFTTQVQQVLGWQYSEYWVVKYSLLQLGEKSYISEVHCCPLPAEQVMLYGRDLPPTTPNILHEESAISGSTTPTAPPIILSHPSAFNDAHSVHLRFQHQAVE